MTDTEEISLGPGATLKLTIGTKPKLHAVSPAMWIAANARIMAALYDSDDLDHGAAKDYMAYTVNWHRDTPGLRFWRMTKSTDADRQQPGSDGDRTHSTCAQCC